METITVFKDSYDELRDREFKQMTQLAELKCKIRAYSTIIDTDPTFVAEQLKLLVKDLEKGVDIS